MQAALYGSIKSRSLKPGHRLYDSMKHVPYQICYFYCFSYLSLQHTAGSPGSFHSTVTAPQGMPGWPLATAPLGMPHSYLVTAALGTPFPLQVSPQPWACLALSRHHRSNWNAPALLTGSHGHTRCLTRFSCPRTSSMICAPQKKVASAGTRSLRGRQAAHVCC